MEGTLCRSTTRQELKPWEMLDDLDLVVVRDPSSGQTGYGVFMGSGGEIFGYAVYRGSGGFSTYRNLIDEKAEINTTTSWNCWIASSSNSGPE